MRFSLTILAHAAGAPDRLGAKLGSNGVDGAIETSCCIDTIVFEEAVLKGRLAGQATGADAEEPNRQQIRRQSAFQEGGGRLPDNRGGVGEAVERLREVAGAEI